MTELPTFVNEPIGELRRAPVRDELQAGMAKLERELPLRVPVWIGDGKRHTGEQLGRSGDKRPSGIAGQWLARLAVRGRHGRNDAFDR